MALGDLIRNASSNSNNSYAGTSQASSVWEAVSGYSSSDSNYNSVNSNYKETAKSTAPLADYNPYADGAPQSVIDAENELNHRSIPNQEYAQRVQDTIIRDNLGYLSDPNYKGTYSALEASQAFEYLSRANEGASYSNWAPPKADDQLFTEIVPQWDAARNIRAKATEQYNAPLPTAEQSIIKSVYNNPQLNTAQREILNADQIQRGDWRTMSWIDRLKALSLSSSNLEDTIENAPDWAKYVQNIFPSLMASGAGAALGALIPIPGASLIGAGIVGGLTYLQGITKVQIPVINELLYGMDILSVWAEQGQGAIGATLKETWDRSMADGTTDLWELGKTMGDVLKDFPDLWEVGQLSYEVGADLGFDNIFNFGRNLVAGASDALFGTDFGQVDTNTVSRANLGIGGLVETNPETRGYDSLTHVYMPLYRTIRDEAVRQGMDYSEAKAFAVNHLSELLTNYMGTTGQANDFGASSIFDPLNFLPTIEAEVADSIGKRTNDTALQNAAKAAKEGASPIVDAFSVPLIQPIAEFITGKHATQGMDTILNVYAKELQTKVPVKDLTTLQKRIAGIDNNGMIKNYNHESNVIKRWLGTTEEAKLYSMSENIANMLGSIFFDTELNPEIIPEMISEFVGISPITPDGPLSAFADSAMLKTMQSTMKDITIKDIQDIQKSVDSFRSLNTNRVAVDTVADKLHMKIGDIFDALDDPKKSAELKQKILKENITLTDERTKITWSPEEVYNKIDAFSQSNVGRGQYSMDLFKVQIMDKISQKSQNALLDRYNIKPDAWQNRLFDLMKSTQSITLLNYSPSYFINNALNNIITRSAVGVGGFDTKSIKTSNEKRGLHSSRDSQIYTDAQNKIGAKKTKDDLIGKVKTKWEDITGTDKVSGKILKGFNNIDIESLEKRAAFDIGANRYWEATWKPGLNIPEIPSQLVALGFTPEMNETIYKLAMDSNTLSEFKQKLAGDVILPGASSTLGQMIGKNYSQTAQPLIRNLIDSMPWIREAVDDLLATGNPETIRQGFQTIIDKVSHDIDIENVVQLSSDFNNLVTQIAGSGFTEFINSKMAVDDLYNDIWINQSTESEMLFAQRIAAARIPEDQFRPEYEAMLSRRNADYAMVRKYDVNHLAATIVGLGLKDDIAKTLILNKLQQYDNMQKYVTEEHNLFMKFADRTSPDYDYAYYAQSKLDMLQKVQNMQLDSYRQFDEVIVQYLRDNLDKFYTEMINKYEKDCADIQRYRAELNAKEIEWLQARMDEPDLYERHKISEEQNSERNILKNNIMGQMFDANRNLEILADGFEKPKNKGQINLSLEQTLWLELLYREANETVANSGEFLSHYIDKSDPKTVFEPSDFSNTNVKESFVEYGKRTQSPENIEAMRQVYANGDAVPLGSVDVKNERMPDEMMGTDYNPIDTLHHAAYDYDYSEINQKSSPGIGKPTSSYEQAYNNIKDTYIQAINYKSVDNTFTNPYYYLPEKVKKSLTSDLESHKTATEIRDNAIKKLREQLTSKTKKLLQETEYSNTDVKQLIDYVLYNSTDVFTEFDKDKYNKINNNYERIIVDPENTGFELETIVSHGIEHTKKILNIYNDIKNIENEQTSNLKKSPEIIKAPKIDIERSNNLKSTYDNLEKSSRLREQEIEKNNKKIEEINTEFTKKGTGLDFLIKNATDKDKPELVERKNKLQKIIKELESINEQIKKDINQINEQTSSIEKEFSKNLSEAQRILDRTPNNKFDSYGAYAKWMEEHGVYLIGDNDFIPRKYQSEKYLSDLKKIIKKASSEKTRLESELGKNLMQLDLAERKGSVNGRYAKEVRGRVHRLRLDIIANEKDLISKLAKDDYYRLWLDNSSNRKFDDRQKNKYGRVLRDDKYQKTLDVDNSTIKYGVIQEEQYKKTKVSSGDLRNIEDLTKLDYGKLLKSVEENFKGEADSDKLISRRESTGEYKKPEQQKNVSIDPKERLDQLYREATALNAEKNKLLLREKQAKSDTAREKINKEIRQISVNINKVNDSINETLAIIDSANPNRNLPIDQPVANPVSNPIDNTPPWDDIETPPWDDVNIPSEINNEPIPQQIDDVPPWDETELPPWNDIDLPPEEDTDSVPFQYNNTPIEVMNEIDNALKNNKKYVNSENPYERFQLSTEAAKSYIDDRLNEIFKKADIDEKDKGILKDRFETSAKSGIVLLTESEFYNDFIQNHPEIAGDLQSLSENVNDIRDYYKDITGIKDSLQLNRDNLYNLGLRAGYPLEVADAFAEYITKVADKWNDNHPGKDFFKDAPGMDLNVQFFDHLSEPTTVYGVENRRPRGGYNYLAHLIKIFGNTEDHTLLHEVGHGFQYTLDEASSRELAKYFGWSYEEYVRLRDAYTTGNFSNANDTAKWKDGAEVFARGFVDYLQNGVAPTKGMANVFSRFKNFLKELYNKIQRLYDKESPNSYKPQTNAFNNGEEFYVHANDVRNGVTLKQIFDMLIAEDPTIKETPIPEASKSIPVETKQIPVNQPKVSTSPKSTNQKIDSFIESGIKKIIDDNKSVNPKLEKISAQDLKNITNSIKVDVYNKTGNNIDTSEQTGWADVLKNYVDDASIEKINSAVSDFIDQATRFKQQNSTSVDAKREFTPYKANWQKSDAKLSMVRTQPFYYNDQLVKAGVVHNGEIIAYITTTMPDTISVGGYTFPVIGVDTFDPNALWLYVKDEPIKVTPGKPNGVDYSVFAENGEHPMRFGTTPTTEPWGTAAWETSLPLREALNLWRDEALEQLQTNLNNGSFFGKLTPEQQKALYSWVDGKLQSAYNYQRFAANRYGDTMVDLSMLNYNDRHGFDNALTALMPYQYWITRSVMNWGRRMIDQPKWFSMYARLEKLIEKNKRDFLPSRLEGMVGIPLPFMPKGLGQGLYFNPFDIALPFKQFYNFSEYFDRNLHTIHKNTISVIEEHYREGRPYNGHIITKQEYDDAMLGKGNLYNQVFWDQRNSDETNTGLSGLVSSYFNPNVLVSSLWKAIESKSSHGKDLSYSPMYKLGNTLRASARDTAAEGIFGILADVLQMPDKTWRKVLNAESDPIGSNWTDYWTVKYLTDMLYSKEHSYNEVFNAIAEGENNPLWQEARNRYSTSEAYKQQGGAILNEVMQSIAGNKPTSFGNIAGTALASIFGGRTYTSGEEDYRRMQDLYYNVKNDPGMYDEFWKQLPEYKVGGYAYKIDNREDLLHTMLVDNCSNAYYALPKDQQQAVYNGLGKQFQQLFIDKETRAPDQIDNRTLIEWTRAMQGNVPNIADATLYQPMQDAFAIQWYSDSLQGLIDRFNRDKKQRYPGIDTIEQGYYNTQLKDQYLAIHPELREYWNWKESAGMANPQLGAYHARQTAENKVNSGKYNDITEAIKSQVNNYSRTCLDNHIKKGWSLPASVEHQLKVAYTNLGVTIPFETWLKEIQW